MNQNKKAQACAQPKGSGNAVGGCAQPEGSRNAVEEYPQPEENLQLEEVLAQVEQCIACLENPQVSLEDSFRYYEEGIRKLRICNEKVDRIEKQMLIISSRGEMEDERAYAKGNFTE